MSSRSIIGLSQKTLYGDEGVSPRRVVAIAQACIAGYRCQPGIDASAMSQTPSKDTFHRGREYNHAIDRRVTDLQRRGGKTASDGRLTMGRTISRVAVTIAAVALWAATG